MSKNITTPWTFQDGREYLLSLTVVEHPTVNASLSLKLCDKITAEEWSCGHDAKYVENLTQKTGSYKPFPVFISMIQSALLKKSESVALDLLNLSDLEHLRAQKDQQLSPNTTYFGKCSNFNFKPNGDLNLLGIDNTGNGIRDKCQNDESPSSKKKFLIIQYSAEFDKVHYPIPLNYSGAPNLQVMQKNILQLKSEVVSLRNAKSNLEEEVVLLKQSQGFSPITTCTDGMKSCNLYSSNEIMLNQLRQNLYQKLSEVNILDSGSGSGNKMRDRCPEDQALFEKLAQRLDILEEKLKIERADHQRIIDTLQAENDFLRQKLSASEKYEEDLEDEIFHLTHNGARLPSGTRIRERNELKTTFSSRPFTIGNSGDTGFIRTGRGKASLAHLGRKRGSPGISPLPRRSQSFSPSPNRRRRPSFDPTAYIREKKEKQELMAQLRLDKIKSQLRYSSSSSIEGNNNDRNGRIRSISSRETSPGINGLLRRRTTATAKTKTENRLSSRSPIPRRKSTTTQTTNHKLESLYKEIDDRLGRGRTRETSLDGKNDMVRPQNYNSSSQTHQEMKKSHKQSRIPAPNPTSLHAHVDKLVREEFPILGLDRVPRRKSDLNHDLHREGRKGV